MQPEVERKLEDVRRTMRLVRSVPALAVLVLRERALVRERAELRKAGHDAKADKLAMARGKQ